MNLRSASSNSGLAASLTNSRIPCDRGLGCELRSATSTGIPCRCSDRATVVTMRGIDPRMRTGCFAKAVLLSTPVSIVVLRQRFPVLVQMEKYAGGKRTRVIRVIEDEDDWPKR